MLSSCELVSNAALSFPINLLFQDDLNHLHTTQRKENFHSDKSNTTLTTKEQDYSS